MWLTGSRPAAFPGPAISGCSALAACRARPVAGPCSKPRVLSLRRSRRLAGHRRLALRVLATRLCCGTARYVRLEPRCGPPGVRRTSAPSCGVFPQPAKLGRAREKGGAAKQVRVGQGEPLADGQSGDVHGISLGSSEGLPFASSIGMVRQGIPDAQGRSVQAAGPSLHQLRGAGSNP